MKSTMPRCLPGLLALIATASAGSAFANSFDITPNTSTFPFTWSISIDGAGATANPDLEVKTGQPYTFTLTNVSFHPFWIDRDTGIGGSLASNPYPYPSAALSDNGV